jgi:hypothetical protein
MRSLFIVALLILLMVVGGWLVFSYSGGTAKVELRTDAVKRDVENAIDETKEFISK